MKTRSPWWASPSQSLFFFAILSIAPGTALAQADRSERPPNSHGTPYGSNWECDRDYMKLDQSCVAIKMPAYALLAIAPGTALAQVDLSEWPPNSHAKRYGSGWECDRDYMKLDQSCVAIKMPAYALLAIAPGTALAQVDLSEWPPNSHAKRYGSGWECDRDYMKLDQSCVAIKMPAYALLSIAPGTAPAQADRSERPPNSHGTPYGSNWECDRDYMKLDQSCVAIKMPAYALLAIAPGTALAQVDLSEWPPNSHAKRYGSGWECDRDYMKLDQSCVAIKMPPYAFLGSFGDTWECDRGYREVNEECEVVQVPPNALLDYGGHGWECRRGYREVDQSCVQIQIPPDAFLDYSGERWECNRGYRPVQEACVSVDVPPNAFLNSRGNGWECDRGYQNVGQSCVKIEVPANAYLDRSGDRWKCDRGYRPGGGKTCVLVEIPLDGYLARSGNEWECGHGFRKSGESCVPIEVPPNGYLKSSGVDWDCDRYYQKSGGLCVAFEVPANAHLNSSGNDWGCDRGYRRSGKTCSLSE